MDNSFCVLQGLLGIVSSLPFLSREWYINASSLLTRLIFVSLFAWPLLSKVSMYSSIIFARQGRIGRIIFRPCLPVSTIIGRKRKKLILMPWDWLKKHIL